MVNNGNHGNNRQLKHGFKYSENTSEHELNTRKRQMERFLKTNQGRKAMELLRSMFSNVKMSNMTNNNITLALAEGRIYRDEMSIRFANKKTPLVGKRIGPLTAYAANTLPIRYG